MKTSSQKILLAAGAVLLAATLALIGNHRSSKSGCCCPSIASMSVFAAEAAKAPATNAPAKAALPRLVDLGADKCIPCKAMAPILKELKTEYAGRMEVEFVDVWKNPKAAKPYKIKLIPTQIFFDASGKERFRHEGFYGKEDILAKWKELGVDLKAKASSGIVRETPVAADTRPRDAVCFMCDENVNPNTKTVVKGQSEQRVLCGPHCYFIYLSSIVGADAKAEEVKVSVTDWASGKLGG